MLAAIYARRSKEQHVADEAKSVTRQEALAREFARSRDWTVTDVFVDDGISGAEFGKRPGLQRLLNSLLPRPRFATLIVSEQKSIGRESAETMFVIKQLAEAGVEIFEYVHGRSLTPKNWLDKVTSAVLSAADEAAQRQSSERVHEAHTRLHQAGHIVGGRVFGYRNHVVYHGTDRDGNPLRSHVEREINPEEAAVVRRIFEMYDSGFGVKRIAKILTAEGVPEPTHAKRKDGLEPVKGWAPSTVRYALSRQSYYTGVFVWNKTRKRNDWGKWAPTDRPEDEWIRTAPNPDLQIIDEALWKRVESRRTAKEGRTLRFADGRMSGRPPKTDTQNLLAGMATCGVCGGGMVVETGGKKRGRKPEYICHRHRANASCPNNLRISVAEVNEAVLSAVEAHALTPEAIEQVIQLTERDDVREHQAALLREQKDNEKRIARLTLALETGGELGSLLTRLRELEARQVAIGNELRALRPVPRLAPDVVENRLSEWRRLLRASTTQGRAVLQRILVGRVTFTPRADGQGYDFSAPTRFDKLFSGIVAPRPAFVRGTDGTEHIGPDDTLETDYGRLLEATLCPS
jgi:DNA invertase Pin-like site-specific DNA recombinase